MSTKSHPKRGQKCPQDVPKSVHEMSPIMSTRCLPPMTTKLPDMTGKLRRELSLKILDSIWKNQIQWNASPVLSWQIFSLFVFTQRKLASPKTFWLSFTSEPWVFLVYTVLEPLLHLPICQPKICFHMKQKWNYVGQSSFEVLWLNEQNFYFKKKKRSCEILWNLVKSRKIS